MFPHVSDKVNICDVEGIMPGIPVSIYAAGKFRAALDNAWSTTHNSFGVAHVIF